MNNLNVYTFTAKKVSTYRTYTFTVFATNDQAAWFLAAEEANRRGNSMTSAIEFVEKRLAVPNDLCN